MAAYGKIGRLSGGGRLGELDGEHRAEYRGMIVGAIGNDEECDEGAAGAATNSYNGAARDYCGSAGLTDGEIRGVLQSIHAGERRRKGIRRSSLQSQLTKSGSRKTARRGLGRRSSKRPLMRTRRSRIPTASGVSAPRKRLSGQRRGPCSLSGWNSSQGAYRGPGYGEGAARRCGRRPRRRPGRRMSRRGGKSAKLDAERADAAPGNKPAIRRRRPQANDRVPTPRRSNDQATTPTSRRTWNSTTRTGYCRGFRGTEGFAVRPRNAACGSLRQGLEWVGGICTTFRGAESISPGFASRKRRGPTRYGRRAIPLATAARI